MNLVFDNNDHEIIEQIASCVGDDAAEEWANMCSDIPVDDKKATLDRANKFCVDHRLTHRVTDVDTSDDDGYSWTWIAKNEFVG